MSQRSQSVSNGFDFSRTQSFGNKQHEYEMRKSTMANHYQNLVAKNSEYFDLVSGKKEGFQAGNIAKKYLVLDYKKGGQSEYQKEFEEKDNKNKKIDTTYYTMQYHNKQPMQLKTTNRDDFKDKEVPKYVRATKKQNQDYFLPFAGVTSYSTTYQHFNANPAASIKPPAHPTVVDAEFSGKTYYNQNFKGEQVPYDPEIEYMISKNKRGQFKSPINPDFPFLGETTTKFYHQPYKTKKQQSYGRKRQYDPLPSFDGQFMSTKQKDFIEKDFVRWGKEDPYAKSKSKQNQN